MRGSSWQLAESHLGEESGPGLAAQPVLEVGGDDGGDGGAQPGDLEYQRARGLGRAVQDQRAVRQSDHRRRGVDVEAGHRVVLHTVDVVRLLVHHGGAGEAVLLATSRTVRSQSVPGRQNTCRISSSRPSWRLRRNLCLSPSWVRWPPPSPIPTIVLMTKTPSATLVVFPSLVNRGRYMKDIIGER